MRIGPVLLERARRPAPRPLGLVAVAFAGILAGCAYRERAEAVYLYQHRAHSALVVTIDDLQETDPALSARLYEAEEELARACAPIQEAGQRTIFGKEVDRSLELAVMSSLDECEATAAEVEAVVRETNPEFAQQLLATP